MVISIIVLILYILYIKPILDVLLWNYNIITSQDKYEIIITELTFKTDLSRSDLKFIFPYTTLESEIQELKYQDLDVYTDELIKKLLEKAQKSIKKFWVGLLEGSGSIQVNHWKKKNLQFRLEIKLKNCNENFLMFKDIQKAIGGYIRFETSKKKERDQVVWRLTYYPVNLLAADVCSCENVTLYNISKKNWLRFYEYFKKHPLRSSKKKHLVLLPKYYELQTDTKDMQNLEVKQNLWKQFFKTCTATMKELEKEQKDAQFHIHMRIKSEQNQFITWLAGLLDSCGNIMLSKKHVSGNIEIKLKLKDHECLEKIKLRCCEEVHWV
ncbi:hypothetical protein ACTA71_008743, partial [Dictyostelium dimigraforme]